MSAPGVIVPSVDPDRVPRPHPLLVAAVAVMIVGVAGVATAVSSTFAAAPAPRPEASAITAPAQALGAGEPAGPRWRVVATLPDDADTVVAAGDRLVVISDDSMWPVRLLVDRVWRPVSGTPIGFVPTPSPLVVTDDGFGLVGAVGERVVLLTYDDAGRFTGTRTAGRLRPGVTASPTGGVVVFDRDEPVGLVLGAAARPVVPPGVVAGAAGVDRLVVVVESGVVYLSEDLGRTWERIGSGYRGVVGREQVVAVGESVTVGLGLVEAGGIRPLPSSPHGRTSTADRTVVVEDVASDSLWVSDGEAPWERLGLWTKHGFTDDLVSVVDGTDAPTVVGVDGFGVRRLWAWSG